MGAGPSHHQAERTLIDLVPRREDPSLIADAYRDARDIGLDYERLGKLVRETSATPKRERLSRSQSSCARFRKETAE